MGQINAFYLLPAKSPLCRPRLEGSPFSFTKTKSCCSHLYILLQETTTTAVTAGNYHQRSPSVLSHAVWEALLSTSDPITKYARTFIHFWGDRGLNACTAALCSSSERTLPWGLLSHTGGTRYLLSKYNWELSQFKSKWQFGGKRNVDTKTL